MILYIYIMRWLEWGFNQTEDFLRPGLVPPAHVACRLTPWGGGAENRGKLQSGAADEPQWLPWRSLIQPKLKERARAEAQALPGRWRRDQLNTEQALSEVVPDGVLISSSSGLTPPPTPNPQLGFPEKSKGMGRRDNCACHYMEVVPLFLKELGTCL